MNQVKPFFRPVFDQLIAFTVLALALSVPLLGLTQTAGLIR